MIDDRRGIEHHHVTCACADRWALGWRTSLSDRFAHRAL